MGLSWSDVGNTFLGAADPFNLTGLRKNPAQQTANDIRELGKQAIDYSGDVRNRTSGYTQGAMNFYGPAQDGLYQYGAFAGGPTTLGNAYNSYLGGRQTPNSQNQYQSSQSILGGPSQTQQTFSQLPGMMGPNRSAGMYGMTQQMGPSRQDTNYTQFSPQLGATSNRESFYGQNQLGATGQTSSVFSQQAGGLSGPGAFEQAAPGFARDAQGAGRPLQGEFSRQQSSLGGQGYGEGRYTNANAAYREMVSDSQGIDKKFGERQGELAKASPGLENIFRSANDVQGFGQRNLGQLETPGMLEQLARQEFESGSNPYLDRLQEKRTAALNQQLAARGRFDSGQAAKALGEQNAEFDAQRYATMADRLGQADTSQRARLAQGQGLTESMSGEKRALGSNLTGLATGRESEWQTNEMNRDTQKNNLVNRFVASQGLLNNAAQGADGSRLARDKQLGDMAQGVSGMNLAGAQAGAGIYRDAQSMGLNRVGALGALAGSADVSEINRYGARGAAAGAADSGLLQRAGMAGSLAGGADNGVTSYMDTGIRAAGAADGRDMAGAGMMMGGAGAVDTQTLGRLGMLGTQAGAADSYRLGEQGMVFGAAGGVDNTSTQRQGTLLNGQLGLAGSQAGTYLGGSMGGESLAMQPWMFGMQGYGNAIGIEGQGRDADYNKFADFNKMGLSFLAGGGMGGPQMGAPGGMPGYGGGMGYMPYQPMPYQPAYSPYSGPGQPFPDRRPA